MTSAAPSTVAVIVALTGTFAIVAYAFLWALTSTRPVRARTPLTGRAASPYRYMLQDERGLTVTPTPILIP